MLLLQTKTVSDYTNCNILLFLICFSHAAILAVVFGFSLVNLLTENFSVS